MRIGAKAGPLTAWLRSSRSIGCSALFHAVLARYGFAAAGLELFFQRFSTAVRSTTLLLRRVFVAAPPRESRHESMEQ